MNRQIELHSSFATKKVAWLKIAVYLYEFNGLHECQKEFGGGARVQMTARMVLTINTDTWDMYARVLNRK